MLEPGVRRRAVPVLDPGGDVHHIAGTQLPGLPAPLLVPAPAADANEHLTAAAGGTVDVPVVPAPRLEFHVEHRHLLGGQGREVALPNEILGKSIVFPAHRKSGELCGVNRLVPALPIDLPNQREGAPRLGPAAVKGQLGHDLHGLLFGDAVVPADGKVGFELGIQPRREQRRNGDHAAVPGGELFLPGPDLAKEDVVVQLRECRGEIAQEGSACRLLFCHDINSFPLRCCVCPSIIPPVVDSMSSGFCGKPAEKGDSPSRGA